jgi:hypothetical protein
MRTLFIFLSLTFLFSSCVSIYFTETQPKNGKELTEIPKELIGIWKNGNNGYSGFDINGGISTSYIKDSLDNIIDTVYEKTPLSDSVKMFKAKDIYVLNFKEKGNPWEIIALQVQKNGDINGYWDNDPNLFSSDRDLKLLKSVYANEEGEYKTFTSLDPKSQEELSLKSATFSGQMNFKTLKKMASKKRILFILKKDGTIYYPSEAK